MSAHLRRIIDLGSGATLAPGSAGDLRFHDNRTYFAETKTSWVRLWADWPTLQPDPTRPPDDPGGPGAAHLQALEDQIRVANEDGIKVALLLYRFPLWANGLEALGAQRNTDAEISFGYPDRIAPADWARYVAAGRDPARVNPSRRALELFVPAEGVGRAGFMIAWARFFEFAYARWQRGRAGAGPYVHAFELVNEPNFQLWPQRAPAPGDDPFALADLTVQATVAQMLRTAADVAARHGDDTLIFAPSLADSELGGRTVTQYDEFAGKLLDALDAAGYRAGPNVAWAHHNYTDLERRSTETKAQRLRAVLAGRWTGYVEGAAPTVFMTEGGVRLSKMAAYYPQEERLAAQARSWQLGWDAHHRDDGPGAGIAMLAQYTTYAEPRFDSGLLDPWPAVVRRPAYAVWTALPRYD
jgi:hypothetical protein